MAGDIEAICGVIREHERFIVSAHLNPDGDAEASQLSVANLLRAIGKEAIVVNDEGVPLQYRFLPESDKVLESIPDGYAPDAVIIIDTPRREAINCGAIRKHFTDDTGDTLGASNWSEITTIFLDHHSDSDGLGDHVYVDSSASSSSAIVYRLMTGLDVAPNPIIGSQITAGIMTDTGRFCFEQTNAEALTIVATMVEEGGVNISDLTNELFFKNSYEALAHMAQTLSTLEVSPSGRVASVVALEAPLDENGTPVEIENLADYPVTVRGVELGMFMRPNKQGTVRISVRSADQANANEFAHKFGGGGHRKAAGLRMEGSVDEVRSKLVEAAEAFVEETLPR